MQVPTLLDTDLVRTFLAIHETGSFSAAARRVLRTPSAVSMQVKRLEEQLGRVLFERRPREAVLTPDGELFLTYAEEMLRLSEAALARFAAPPLEGTVRLGVPDDFGTHVLPMVLARFAASHPGVDVRVSLDSSARLRERQGEGGLDVILHTVCAREGGAGRAVHEEALVWAGKRGGRAWRNDPVPLALAAEGCAWRRNTLKALGESGKAGRIAYVSESGQALRAAVAADLAITSLPVSGLTPDLERLGTAQGFGEIGRYQLRLVEREGAGCAAGALAEHIVESYRPEAPVAAE